MVVYSAAQASLNVTVTEIAGVAILTLTGPSTVMEDSTNSYGGKLTGMGGAGIDGAWIDLSWQPAGGAGWTFLVTAITSGGGNYSVPLMFANPGNIVLKAFWSGGSVPG